MFYFRRKNARPEHLKNVLLGLVYDCKLQLG